LASVLGGFLGCADRVVTFQSVSLPERSAAPNPEPTTEPEDASPPMDASVPEPPLGEFDLGQPRGGDNPPDGPPGEPPPPPNFDCDDAGVCRCETDYECPPSTPACDPEALVCVGCTSSQDCVLGFGLAGYCDEGSCRGCLVDSECFVGWSCQNQVCVAPCERDRDCAPGWFCQGNVCALGEMPP
jgi:hypothetical protein